MFDFGGQTNSIFGVEKCRKQIFNLCSHIQKNTQNPTPIFKISIYCTKYTKHVKTHSFFFGKISKNIQMFNFSCYYLSIFHNSPFVSFVFFVIFVNLPRPAKIKQDQPKERQLAETNREYPGSKTRERRCPAAWRLQ